MGFFSKLVGKKDKVSHKRSTLVILKNKEVLTSDSVKLTFTIPPGFKSNFAFKPGQYISVHIPMGDHTEIRSYSICSAPSEEEISIGVKAVKNGKVSNYLFNNAKVGEELLVDYPLGNFTVAPEAKTIVAFAAGSGITPLLSIAKSLEGTDRKMHLFYGSKSLAETMFRKEIKELTQTTTQYFFSKEVDADHHAGRLNKVAVSEVIKSNLSLLRADAFYLCGPEEMIVASKEVLEQFGVKPEQIHFELFTTPVLMKSEEVVSEGNYEGISQLTAIVDGEVHQLEMSTKGKTILDVLDQSGADIPYSCRGGVCCSCKAKVIEGSASMKVNYALTNEEIKNGYILTCQAHPTSQKIKIDFDA